AKPAAKPTPKPAAKPLVTAKTKAKLAPPTAPKIAKPVAAPPVKAGPAAKTTPAKSGAAPLPRAGAAAPPKSGAAAPPPAPGAKGAASGHKPSAGEIAGRHAEAAPRELTPQDVEARKRRLKNLIVLGKERGYLTYAEINDHLPEDILDAEQIEGIISMIGDMGIQVYDETPDAEALLMSETPATVPAEDVEEEAEA